jgi:hypothetical protein
MDKWIKEIGETEVHGGYSQTNDEVGYIPKFSEFPFKFSLQEPRM